LNRFFESLRDESILTCAVAHTQSESGGCAAAPDFSLLAQRKVSKRKGTLLSPDRCASRRSRREKNSALRTSNTFSLHP
jgi:hypothetical protein